MYDCGKSDSAIVPVKSANNDTDDKVSAEWMEIQCGKCQAP